MSTPVIGREGLLRLVAILTVDRPRDLLQGRRVIAATSPVDVGLLTDPAVPIKDAAGVP